MDFPRLVYRSADVYRRAENQEALDALRADGWFASVPEAQRGEHDMAPEPEPGPIPDAEPEPVAHTTISHPRPRTKRPK